jgi:hypothetical protein
MYTYNLTCTAGSVSATQSLNVTVAASGGGGALDLSSLLLLVGLLTLYCHTTLQRFECMNCLPESRQ